MAFKSDINQGKLLFKYMLAHPKYLKFINERCFENNDLQYVATKAKEFYNEFGEPPSMIQMQALMKGNTHEITNETIESLYNIDVESADVTWIKETCEGFIRYKTMINNVCNIGTYLKTTDVSLSNVNHIVENCCEMFDGINTVSFDDNLGFNFFDPECHKPTITNKIPYTWDYWNKVSKGGIDTKTLSCYLGGTNVGKSILLCNDAAEFIRQGKNVLFVTCEMSEAKVGRRIAANLLDITLEEYDKLVSNGKIKQKLKNFVEMSLFSPGKLFIKEYPTGQCTVHDIESELKELREKEHFNVDVIIVDYISIMCNYRNPNSENTYMKLKQLSEDLRGIAVKNNIAVITACQIGRGALNTSDIELTDCSESMGLTHTCDNIIGIIQTEEMRIGDYDAERGVTVPHYWLKILKIREGEGKGHKWRCDIIYDKMKLIEKDEIIDTSAHLVQ